MAADVYGPRWDVKPVTALMDLTFESFDLRELFIPVVFELVKDQIKHLGNDVVYTFDSTVAAWVVGAVANFFEPLEADKRRAKAWSRTGGKCLRGC